MGHHESSGISAEYLLLLFSCLPALQIVGGVTRVGVIRGSVTPSLYPLRYLHTKPTQRLEDLNILSVKKVLLALNLFSTTTTTRTP